eukprot:CAMPEP_0183370998 /NCGR_PEP_ID=MMETSP0164_2-20130417/104080_1 /TAXON_ID=221442 /ORGANISM="Coccolithus pelagicus ssp braarudi, Strain PLY182g" /LENGTH=43 /DNA_ID= /DNA_START= /DNA_END= /DNA_ORIENTATION=
MALCTKGSKVLHGDGALALAYESPPDGEGECMQVASIVFVKPP